ncbi:MAG: hypothetical protein RMI94_11265 [Bryobacterales bacterium]|nr:hypothetical protein [Bryobacteraceae bacterium]MDW8131120.1 hypothetical protein [Bryobacterales bacterium]
MKRSSAPGKCSRSRARALWLGALAALCVLAYLPSLSLPFISDDYVQIRLAREWGPVSAWPALAADALYRSRATSLLMTYWTERAFGLEPLAYRLSSLLLHVLNTWLVSALGRWRVVGWRVALPAAAFFAIYEGHQEAVIWYAALPELLVFTFVLLCVLAWVRWLETGGWTWYAAALGSFLLALYSKESAVAVLGLQVVAIWFARQRRWAALFAMAPFATVAAAYTLAIFEARSGHLHFSDGTFSLSAPFWWTLANSTRRLLWFWGLLALAAVLWLRRRRWRFLLAAGAAWILITFLPYSFLTYMPHVPSRHTYLASVGSSWLVAAGFLAVRPRLAAWRRWAPGALALLMLAHNCGYLWTRKQRQYRERAAPTEALVEFAAKTDRPVEVRCFPYSQAVADWTLEVRLNRKAWRPGDPGEPAVFCWPREKHP